MNESISTLLADMSPYCKRAFIFLLLALAAYAQERVAILNTVDDFEPSIGISDLAYLTDRLRETAVKILPKQQYGVMTTESIVAFLGSQERMVKECKAASCLAELGRKVSADYVAQARIGRFNKNLTIKTELYSVKSGNLIGSFTGESKDVSGLLGIINKNAPDLFKEMDKRLYSVKLSTEPSGADLSFDIESNSSCTTPCKVELPAGRVRITADLEEYETADTTVSIKQNNQSINIRMKPNFGVLEVKPVYLKGIGEDEQWSLTLNGQSFYSLENKLPADKYSRLYDWPTAIKACPKGWHLPNKEEWYILVDFVGGDEIAGKKLKATSGWNKNGNGEDKFGFSVLPGGWGNSSGSFGDVGYYGGWWSATELDAYYAYNRSMSYGHEDVDKDNDSKGYLHSVRCVKD